jgi:acetyl esterase/lipase
MLLFVHGGGWARGDKLELRWLGEKLARDGVLVAIANYRLSPAVKHPAHAQDVARAAAWLHRHGAEHGGDLARLYLAGHSAGAHLVSLVALDPSYLAAEGLGPEIVRGVAGIGGAAYDLDSHYRSMPLAPLFVQAFGPDPGRWREAAPLRYVGKDTPPFLLVHGLNDADAPAASSQKFAVGLQRAGVPVELELLPGHDHYSVLPVALPSLRAFVQ